MRGIFVVNWNKMLYLPLRKSLCHLWSRCSSRICPALSSTPPHRTPLRTHSRLANQIYLNSDFNFPHFCQIFSLYHWFWPINAWHYFPRFTGTRSRQTGVIIPELPSFDYHCRSILEGWSGFQCGVPCCHLHGFWPSLN